MSEELSNNIQHDMIDNKNGDAKKKANTKRRRK